MTMNKLFTQVNIESIYSKIDEDKIWEPFWNYIINNSTTYTFHQLSNNELNPNNEEIGGFAESVVISIISNTIYEVGKYFIKDLLEKIKNPANLISYEKKRQDGSHIEFLFPGNAVININFIDNKNVQISLPYPTYQYMNLDNINLRLIDDQLKNSSKAFIYFDSNSEEYKKGLVVDTYS